jgi:hypothetical protein
MFKTEFEEEKFGGACESINEVKSNFDCFANGEILNVFCIYENLINVHVVEGLLEY